MPEIQKIDFIKRLQDYLEVEDYAEGLDFVSQYGIEFPDEKPLVNFYHMCFAARLGMEDRVYETFKDSLNHGLWYNEELLRQSHSLETFWGEDQFEDLVKISNQFQNADPVLLLPLLVVQNKHNDFSTAALSPLLLVLHENYNTAQNCIPHWRKAAEEGWIVALPQSRQAVWSGGYLWVSYDAVLKQYSDHLAKLTSNYPVDKDKVVIAGIGEGADAALWLALNQISDIHGFILINPNGPLANEPGDWQHYLDSYPDLRGVILLNEVGEDVQQTIIQSLGDTLNKNAIPTRMIQYKNEENPYPDNFNDYLTDALAFILEG
ncbi:MAG: hypothetical protein JXA19_01285 [Anaerolineales bacterium]|nr:hypothetical protein [Anaerolineales bacterium]